MRVRRFVCFLLAALVVVPVAARAETHNAEYQGAFSAGNGGSKLKGVNQAITFQLPGKMERLGITADSTVHFGETDAKHQETQFSLLWGVRYAQPIRHVKPLARLMAGGSILVGTQYTNDGTTTTKRTEPAVGFGANLDWCAGPEDTTAGHTNYRGWALRVGVSHLVQSGDREDPTRFTIGAVYRFPHLP